MVETSLEMSKWSYKVKPITADDQTSEANAFMAKRV